MSQMEVNSFDTTSNFALRYALKTMQERCQQLQKRLVSLEDENCNLKMNSSRDTLLEIDSEKSEIEVLRNTVTQLTKQKAQLTQNIMMVSQENRNLWIRLTKLTDANHSLGNQLSKINDTLNQHRPIIGSNNHLIRSKTFTQHSPRENRSEKKDDPGNADYASLEEISLKLIDQLSQEKAQLEEQCAEMAEIHSDVEIDINSLSFAFPNDLDDESSGTTISKHSQKLHEFKDILKNQQLKLGAALEHIKKYQLDNDEKGNLGAIETNFKKIPEDLDKKSNQASTERRICPVCGKVFLGIKQFAELTKHVEDHFTEEDDSITDTYEIATTIMGT